MFSSRLSRRFSLLALLLSLIFLPGKALAAVEIGFYSREFGASFPHAFITLRGVDERTGEKIDTDHGFTATHISPGILLGSVRGEIMASGPEYVSKSDSHFSFVLSDAEYDAVLATVERWRQLKQPSYNLNRQNCVFFVADVAASLGMQADTPKPLMKKPRSYLASLTRANLAWLNGRGARVIASPTADQVPTTQ